MMHQLELRASTFRRRNWCFPTLFTLGVATAIGVLATLGMLFAVSWADPFLSVSPDNRVAVVLRTFLSVGEDASVFRVGVSWILFWTPMVLLAVGYIRMIEHLTREKWRSSASGEAESDLVDNTCEQPSILRQHAPAAITNSRLACLKLPRAFAVRASVSLIMSSIMGGVFFGSALAVLSDEVRLSQALRLAPDDMYTVLGFLVDCDSLGCSIGGLIVFAAPFIVIALLTFVLLGPRPLVSEKLDRSGRLC